MEALCIKLKSVLERHFSMPFEVSSSLVDGEEHYTCSPSNEGAMFFDVRVYIHNHIRLVIEIYPQKHGRQKCPKESASKYIRKCLKIKERK